MKKILALLLIFMQVPGFTQVSSGGFFPLNDQWKYVGAPDFSSTPAYGMDFAVNPVTGEAYIVLIDNSLYVMKYNGSAWAQVGDISLLNCSSPPSLTFNSSGQPYLAVNVGGYYGNCEVLTYDGTNWVQVGNIFPGQIYGGSYPKIAIDDTGKIYVVFEGQVPGLLSVMTCENSSWVYVGDTIFSGGGYTSYDIKINPATNQPYVAYYDVIQEYRLSVKKFNGVDWEYVGGPGFSLGPAIRWASLTFDSAGHPYVAFSDHDYWWKGRVMAYLDTSWVDIGTPPATPSVVRSGTLGFDPFGNLFFSYSDGAIHFKASVMEFNGAGWDFTGEEAVSEGSTYPNKLSFDLSGIPYIAYLDSTYGGDGDYLLGGPCVMKYDSVFAGTGIIRSPGLRCFPNPVSDHLTIECGEMFRHSYLTIINAQGTMVISRIIDQPEIIINMKMLPSGIYFIKLKNEKAVRVSKINKL
ncbi:MAG: T9SS type A sorting domain-containing protein [Bacteroidetes bacterium]|nr:T9SS type A sorting domain-containing protein [Bacteroidota bacterium]